MYGRSDNLSEVSTKFAHSRGHSGRGLHARAPALDTDRGRAHDGSLNRSLAGLRDAPAELGGAADRSRDYISNNRPARSSHLVRPLYHPDYGVSDELRRLAGDLVRRLNGAGDGLDRHLPGPESEAASQVESRLGGRLEVVSIRRGSPTVCRDGDAFSDSFPNAA